MKPGPPPPPHPGHHYPHADYSLTHPYYHKHHQGYSLGSWGLPSPQDQVKDERHYFQRQQGWEHVCQVAGKANKGGHKQHPKPCKGAQVRQNYNCTKAKGRRSNSFQRYLCFTRAPLKYAEKLITATRARRRESERIVI